MGGVAGAMMPVEVYRPQRRTTMTRLLIALLTGAAGIAITLTGLGIDAWLHTQDETLAAREGVFTLSNPGHLLLAAGMALTCGSLLSAVYLAWGMSKAQGILSRRWVRVMSMQAAGALTAGAALFALATSASDHGHAPIDGAAAAAHTHTETTAPDVLRAAAPANGIDEAAEVEARVLTQSAAAQAHIEDAPAPLAATAAPAPQAGDIDAAHPHAGSMEPEGVVAASPNRPTEDALMHADMAGDGDMGDATLAAHAHPKPSADELACLADLTVRAKAANARFEGFDVAMAEGYVANPGDPSETHYPNREYNRDGVVFDLAKPETLIYVTDDAGGKRFVGVMYKALKGQGPTPCGNATFWHTHGQCIDPAGGATIPELKDKTCPAGYAHRDGAIEMMHLWFARRGQRS
jgi:hypothetical protein